jgi:hypothetical protein
MLARAAVNVLSLGYVLVGKALVAAGLRPVPGGWRRVIAVGLRGEATKFAVSAFGLRAPKANLGPALQRFLEAEPHARFRLDHRRTLTARVPTAHVDVVVQRFAADGSLEAIEPHLSPSRPQSLDATDRARVRAALVEAYNRTRQMPEAVRPQALVRESQLAGAEADYSRRLLDACCVSVEPIPPGGRFVPPEFRRRRGLGFGFLTLVVRPVQGSDAVDIWVQAHHSGADGVPVQELATNLERAWGTEPVEFPDADSPTSGPRAASVAGERELFETLTFLDFSPLLALRKRLNARLPEGVTVGALFLWQLSREPEFTGTRYASTVDIAASRGFERDVDLVVLRPADFPATPDGLAAYAREFNRLILAARGRTGPVRAGLQTAELLPAWLHRKSMELNPDVMTARLGSVGLSVLRDAKVFVAPMSDLGYADGFLAIGGLTLPTADGRRVGAVSIKGTREQVERYPDVLRRMLARCESELNSVSGGPTGSARDAVGVTANQA